MQQWLVRFSSGQFDVAVISSMLLWLVRCSSSQFVVAVVRSIQQWLVRCSSVRSIQQWLIRCNSGQIDTAVVSSTQPRLTRGECRLLSRERKWNLHFFTGLGSPISAPKEVALRTSVEQKQLQVHHSQTRIYIDDGRKSQGSDDFNPSFRRDQ